MKIGIIGVNFKSADLAFREKLAQTWQDHTSFLNSPNFTKIILSTCNRFEIYFSSENLTETQSYLLQKFREEFPSDCSFKLYSYFGKDCFFHLSKVTAGLDSAILAETEIQGQVKRAYAKAQNHFLSKELHFIFQKSLRIGKKIRSQVDLKPGAPNLIDTILFFIQSLTTFTEKPKVLFVGTSEINLKIIQKLNRDCFDTTICSRSMSRAQDKAQLYGMQTLAWDKMGTWLDYDALIFATNYPKTLIRNTSCSILNKKVICDLSVPRNVHPKIGEKENIQLYNIDQINKLVRRYRKFKGEHFLDLSMQIEEAVLRQCDIFKNKTQYVEKVKSVI